MINQSIDQSINQFRCELEELNEDRAQIELMIDFYEHRLAHGCYIKNLAAGKGPEEQAKGPERRSDFIH